MIAVVPARYHSTRFPGKPLADKTGKPLIQHVIERVRLAKRVSRIIVATDDRRIFDAVHGFGCDVVMTRQDHPNGTSRIAEAVEALPDSQASIIVNVQGDEPQIEPGNRVGGSRKRLIRLSKGSRFTLAVTIG